MAGLGWLFGELKSYGYTDTQGKEIPELINILNEYRKKDGKEPVGDNAVGYRQNAKYEEVEGDVGEPQDITSLLGQEYKGYKGQEAINKLLQEKNGHIRGAFQREDIGNIDLVWGDDSLGLQHIIKRREEQGINAEAFINDLAEVVENGDFVKKNDRGNFEFWHNKKMVIVSPELYQNKITFVLTAFKKNIKK